MKQIIKSVGTAVVFMASIAGNSFADSSSMTGFHIGITGKAVGYELDGTHTKTLGTDLNTTGQTGVVAMAAGADIGYTFALGDTMYATVSGQYTPAAGDIQTKDVTEAKDVKLAMGDIYGGSLEAGFMLTSNSSIYGKLGYEELQVDVTGTEVNNASQDLTGTVYALGTKTVMDNGFFVKTEAGIVEYDEIKISGILEVFEATSTFTASAKADVDQAYGAMTIGMVF